MALNAESLAELILAGFNRHYRIFTVYNKKAAHYFARSQFHEAYQASIEQIDLYDARVNECMEAVKTSFRINKLDEKLWQDTKLAYIRLLYDHLQPELAESFFNSVSCRLFNRRYYNNNYIFFNTAVNTKDIQTSYPDYRSYYPTENDYEQTIRQLLTEIPVKLPYEDLVRDTRLLTEAIRNYETKFSGINLFFQIHILTPLFYRNKGAYCVGRLVNNNRNYPFVISLLTRNHTLHVDAFLDDEFDISNIFSFARAYFKVDFPVPSAIVRFLRTLLPNKTIADLYTAIGFHKQGKNEFYRAFLYHLRHSNDQFITAPGIEGMVMKVFTLPSYPYVFKLIKDPEHIKKNILPQTIKDCYQIVKRKDRVGRMADVWEFSHVAFPLSRFSAECLEQLQATCASSLHIEGNYLIIKHLYIERRMIPLNLYVTRVDETEQERVLSEYAQAIKDIASAGLFAGDLLTKNFGVTNHGRVVFYDYDEVVPMARCNFRKIPEPMTPEQEMASEPWYSVADNDIFPEEFEYYIVTDPAHKKLLKANHPGLFQAESWQKIQQDIQQGILPDVYPYNQKKRFRQEAPSSSISHLIPDS